MINSRSKGCKAERDLAKQLGNWASVTFARTPSSGGLSWKTANAKGDIVCTKEGHYFPFCIEVKFHKEIDLNSLVVSNNKHHKIQEFWEQCTRDALLAKKVPILFMRYNRMPKEEWIIVMYTDMFKFIGIQSPNINTLELVGSTRFPQSITIANSKVLWAGNYKQVKLKLKNIWKQWQKTGRIPEN